MIHPTLEQIPAALFSPRKMLGYTRAFATLFFPDPSGKPPSLTLNTFLGDRHSAFAKEIRQLAGGKSSERELPLTTREGDRIFRVRAQVGTRDGERTVTVTLQDVQTYADAVRRLEFSESRTRVLIETSAAALALVRNGRFDYVNKGFLELFGIMLREDLIGKEVQTCAAGRDRKLLAERAQRQPEELRPGERFEFLGERKDGSRIHLQLLEDAVTVDGEPAHLWSLLDITHLRAAQDDVLRHRKENEILDHLLAAYYGSPDQSALVRESVSASLRWLGYEAGCLLASVPGGDVCVLAAEDHLPESLRSVWQSLSAKEGLGGYLFKTMEAVQYTLETYPPFLPYRTALEAADVKTLACLPLPGAENPVGLLLLLSRKPPSPDDTRTAFLSLAAKHLGLSLDRARFTAATRERADALQTMLESLGGAVYETAPDGRSRYLSPAAERLTGYPLSEMTRSPDSWRALVHPDDRSILSERTTRQAGGAESFVLHYRILPKGKASYRWVRDDVRYRRDAGGGIVAVCGILTDITDSKTEEQDRKHAEEVMRGIVDAMGDALVMTDLEGRVIEVNSAFSTLTGFARAESLGITLPYPWLKEEEMANFVQWLTALREQKRLKDFDMRWVRRDGAEVAISISTTLLRNTQGEPVAILNLARDIGERRRQAEEIRQHNSQLAILNAIGQGLAGVLDRQSVFNVVHEHLRDALAYSRIAYASYDPAGGTLETLYSAGGEDEGADALRSERVALSDNDPFNGVLLQQEPYLGARNDWPVVLAVPVASKDGVLGVLWIARQDGEPYEDLHLRIVTSIGNLVAIALDRVALYEDTVAKAREITLRNEELDRFAYVVSHDLKEPLITINGYTKLILDGAGSGLEPDVQQHVASVMRASVRMKQLIDDLLTLSRVGRVPSQVTTVHVSRLLADLLRDLEYTLHERRATVEVPPELPVVHFDPTSLGMVFKNLILNGVMYNRHESPRVRISAAEEGARVHFTVADNGIGIPAHEHAKAFMIFQRLDPTDGIGGTGAGLTITKKIVETYGGTIWIESREGAGTTVHFTVPKHG